MIPGGDGKEVVLMVSGGMDSTVLAYELLRADYAVKPVFFDYGQHSAATELATVKSVLPGSQSVGLRILCVRDVFVNSPSRLVREADLWRDKIAAEDLLLPYRNLVLVAAACAFAASIGVWDVFAAFINSNHAREIDATRSFIDHLERLLGSVGSVHIHMPFRDLAKMEVASLGVANGAPIAETFSCQANARTHCGACPNCVDRLQALASLR